MCITWLRLIAHMHDTPQLELIHKILHPFTPSTSIINALTNQIMWVMLYPEPANTLTGHSAPVGSHIALTHVPLLQKADSHRWYVETVHPCGQSESMVQVTAYAGAAISANNERRAVRRIMMDEIIEWTTRLNREQNLYWPPISVPEVAQARCVLLCLTVWIWHFDDHFELTGKCLSKQLIAD